MASRRGHAMPGGWCGASRADFLVQLTRSASLELRMRYLVWILRLVIFVVVLLFALKNTAPVDVRFFADHVISGVPLIVVMLAVFILGAVFGLLIMAPPMMCRRREAARLRRELTCLEEKYRQPAAPREPAVAPETVAPLAPL